MITSRPARQFQVIGVIDIDAFAVRSLPNDEASFRRAIGKAVCKAGGDAVIPGVNGDRRYVLATVVKWVDDDRTSPICPKPPPDAGTPKADKSHDASAHDAGTKDAQSSLDAGSAAAPSLRSSQAGAPC